MNRISKLQCLMLAFLWVLGASAAFAQERDQHSASLPITVGSRVRIQSMEVGGRLTGLVTALEDRSLTLSPESGPSLKLRLDSLTALETSLGRKRHTLQGLALGALAGAAIGATFKVDPNNCGPETVNFCSRGESMGGGALVFGAVGTVIGALVKTDHWGPVALAPAAPLRQGDRGLGFAVALRF